MNMKEFLEKHPLPWRAVPMEHYNALWDELLDSNGMQVDLVDLVMTINSELQSLNTRDLPGQSTMAYMRWQDGTLLNIGSGTLQGCNQIPLLPLSTGGSQYIPELVENVGKAIHLEEAKVINSLRGAITVNEARTKILGWEPLKGERGDQLLE